jgi:hypothetical protein
VLRFDTHSFSAPSKGIDWNEEAGEQQYIVEYDSI